MATGENDMQQARVPIWKDFFVQFVRQNIWNCMEITKDNLEIRFVGNHLAQENTHTNTDYNNNKSPKEKLNIYPPYCN